MTVFLSSHFLNAVYNVTLEQLENELKAILRQISQHVSMGYQAEIEKLSFIFSIHFFLVSIRWKHYSRCWR